MLRVLKSLVIVTIGCKAVVGLCETNDIYAVSLATVEICEVPPIQGSLPEDGTLERAKTIIRELGVMSSLWWEFSDPVKCPRDSVTLSEYEYRTCLRVAYRQLESPEVDFFQHQRYAGVLHAAVLSSRQMVSWTRHAYADCSSIRYDGFVTR